MGKYNLNVRITEQERQILDQYCALGERTQSDVIREFIRSLKQNIKEGQDNA
ncbi:CopG family transcriptional regulator [Tolypothrix sp. VBCCA 56010]|uniref:CopG family transcriptional regulator n=1 Tax=Tolypothrix sp. VBCCA 56010 TaxID=3137731 RepID=UPI003D7C8C94